MDRKEEEASQGRPEDLDVDGMVREMAALEARRRRVGVVIILAALVFVTGFVGIFVSFRDTVFRPNMPIEQGEQEIYEKTNDPVCREVIDEVTETGKAFFALEPELERHLLGEDPAEIRGLMGQVGALLERLKNARDLSEGAVLRFPESRGQLDKWFPNLEDWLAVFVTLGEERLAALEGDAGADVGVDAAQEEAPAKTDEAPPQERLDRALLAVHDAFEAFRVWHSAGVHPCGAAKGGQP